MEHTSIQISAAYTGTAHNLQVTHVVVYNEFMSLHFKQFLSQAPSVLNVKPPTVIKSVRGIYDVKNWPAKDLDVNINEYFLSIVLCPSFSQCHYASTACAAFHKAADFSTAHISLKNKHIQYDQCSWIHKIA